MNCRERIVLALIISLLLQSIDFNAMYSTSSNVDYMDIIKIEPLINETFVSGVVKLKVFSQKPNVDVYVNNTIQYRLSNGSEWLVEFNTSAWRDDLYVISFVAYDEYGNYSIKLLWFVDNNPPIAELKLPVLTPDNKPWINGSIAPVMDPFLLNESDYVKYFNNSVYYKIYVKGIDRWINYSTLYINDSVAEIYYRDSFRKGVFFGNATLLAYIRVPSSGLYYIKLEVRDLSGKASYSILKVIFDIDKPMLRIDKPINGTITNNTTVGFKLTPIDETSRVCAIGFYITTSVDVKPSLRNYMPLPGRYMVATNESIYFNLTFNKSSKYIVWFIVIDEALNYREEYVTITIDNESPELYFEIKPYDTKLHIKIKALDNISGIEEIRVYINSSLIITSRNSTLEALINASIGYNIVEILAIDRAQNIAYKSTTIYINASTTGTQNLDRILQKPSRSHEYLHKYLLPIFLVIAILLIIYATHRIRMRKT
ncbi:MAG: hypothetical protein QXP72_01110 [Desulfurococcaceae archaeon]